MTDFLLVHGAWHGAWCWSRLAGPLRERGHRVFTPSLTGLGERSSLLAPGNNLTLHVHDVLREIQEASLNSFVLCGHSYGGMVVRKIADEIGEAVKALVYLDAYVPHDGQCGLDLRSREANERLLSNLVEGWTMPAPPAALFGVESEADRRWVDSLLTPMALGCFQEKTRLSATHPDGFPIHYLRTTWPNASLDQAYDAAVRSGWKTEVWSCGHDLMIDRPEQTADYLEQAATSKD